MQGPLAQTPPVSASGLFLFPNPGEMVPAYLGAGKPRTRKTLSQVSSAGQCISENTLKKNQHHPLALYFRLGATGRETREAPGRTHSSQFLPGPACHLEVGPPLGQGAPPASIRGSSWPSERPEGCRPRPGKGERRVLRSASHTLSPRSREAPGRVVRGHSEGPAACSVL